MILGGSTNAVLHLIAIAHSVGINLTIDDFQSVSDRIPFIADLKPSGKYVMEDVHKIGGIPGSLLYSAFLDRPIIFPSVGKHVPVRGSVPRAFRIRLHHTRTVSFTCLPILPLIRSVYLTFLAQLFCTICSRTS